MCDPYGKCPILSSSPRGLDMLRNGAQRPENNANTSSGSENNLYCVESLRFCPYGGNFIV